MPFLRRKAKVERPAPPPAPQVYVWHDQQFMFTTSRFCFIDTLIDDKTEWIPNDRGGVTLSTPGFSPEVRTLQERIMTSLPGLDRENALRPRFYAYYIAVTWFHEEQPHEFLDEMSASIERTVVALLAEHFGWAQPRVAHFRDGSEMRATADQLQVDWRLGHFP